MNGQEHLEQLLIQCGTKQPAETAEALIARFGSLPALTEALSLRMTDNRLSVSAQTLLGMIPGICRQQMLDRVGPAPRLNTFERASEYAAALYVGAHHESIRLLCLDEHMTLTAQCALTEGGLKETSFSPRLLLREALMKNARAVILCHNHPSGRAHFSEADVSSTRALLELCAAADLAVPDHLLAAGDRVIGMRSRLYFPEKLWTAVRPLSPTREEWYGGKPLRQL